MKLNRSPLFDSIPEVTPKPPLHGDDFWEGPKPQSKGLLALDIATKTGFCTHTASGVWDLTPKKNESGGGMRLIRFRGKLREICELEKIKIIAFEQIAIYGKFPNTVGIEMVGVLKLFCHENGIEFTSYMPTQIKKFATGRGGAKKEDMVRAAQQFKRDILSDDEADAFFLYKLAMKDIEL